MTPSRDDAWDLLCAWTEGSNLRRHGLAVEATVGWYGARRFGIRGPELEVWRSAGLLAYLLGPGTAEPHVDPRVIASWDGLDAGWPPARTGPGPYDLGLGPLIAALDAPAVAGGGAARAPPEGGGGGGGGGA